MGLDDTYQRDVESGNNAGDDASQSCFECAYTAMAAAGQDRALPQPDLVAGGRTCEFLSHLTSAEYEQLTPEARRNLESAIRTNPDNVSRNDAGHFIVRSADSTTVYMHNGDRVSFNRDGSFSSRGDFRFSNRDGVLTAEHATTKSGVRWNTAAPDRSSTWRRDITAPIAPARRGVSAQSTRNA